MEDDSVVIGSRCRATVGREEKVDRERQLREDIDSPRWGRVARVFRRLSASFVVEGVAVGH